MSGAYRICDRACGPWPLLVLPLILLVGCTGSTKRLDPDALGDSEVGTGLNSQDFRSVCQRMARSLVERPEIQNATEPPLVAIAPVANNSNDYIDGTEFARKIRTELIKFAEGKIRFLDRELTEPIEAENRAKERSKITGGTETKRHGADYFLTGSIAALDRVAGGATTTYYRLSFRLTNAANSTIMWEDEYEIKKASTMGKVYR